MRPHPLPDARSSGSICAAAAQGQRYLHECARAYPDLFPARPFDPGVLSTLAMANAFSAPRLDAAGLRLVNRASLWAFRVDWLCDYLAESAAEVDDAFARCLAVADGAAPEDGDPLAAFLAGIRDDLAARAGFEAFQAVWRAELSRMLAAMRRELEWRTTGARVSAPAYLDNADNLGSSFVNVTHWLGTAQAATDDAPAVLAATRAQQVVLRIINDLGTVRRDLSWGDLNILRLGATEDDARRLLADHDERCGRALARLRKRQPQMAEFLARQAEFCRGFYGVTDFWGAP